MILEQNTRNKKLVDLILEILEDEGVVGLPELHQALKERFNRTIMKERLSGYVKALSDTGIVKMKRIGSAYFICLNIKRERHHD